MEKYNQLKKICNDFIINKFNKNEFTERFCEITGKKMELKKPFDRDKWVKKYNKKNKEKIKEYNKNYSKNNREKKKGYDKKYNQKKREENIK